MPGPARPNPPDDDPGFEVVGDSKPPAAKPLPPRPGAGKPPPAKPLPSKPAAPPAAKLLPPKPPAAKPLPPAPKKPAVTVVDDDDTVEDRRPIQKKSKTRVVNDDDDEPAEARIVDDEDDDEDDRPRKQGKKKNKKGKGKKLSEGDETFINVWGGPLFLMGMGLVMLIVGTWGQFHGPHAEVSAGIVIALRLVFEIITIPISIVMLMLIGSVMGIEYGTIGNAVRALGAIGLMISGMSEILEWIGVGYFIARPVVFVVALGLMMSLFKLDANEAMVTIFGMNLLSFVFKVLFVIVIIAMLVAGSRRGGGGLDSKDDDGDFEPGIQMNESGIDPDDDEDAAPIPPQKSGRGKQQQPMPVGNESFDPNDNG